LIAMKSPEMRESDSAQPPDAAESEAGATITGDIAAADPELGRFPRSRISAAERERMANSARSIKFPVAVRGYERGAVDRYVEEVNRLIAELEVSTSPESAVRRAVDEVSEETRELLQRAQQTAEVITTRSRARAEDLLEQAERDAKEMRESMEHDVETTRAAARREAEELREAAQRETAELREATSREVATLAQTVARESEELRAAAQREADELRASARRDSEGMLTAAANETRELRESAELIRRERERLIDEVRAVGEQLLAIADPEARHFTRLARNGGAGFEEETEEDTLHGLELSAG
jgi:cell division septum initiation protein DivIVA